MSNKLAASDLLENDEVALCHAPDTRRRDYVDQKSRKAKGLGGHQWYQNEVAPDKENLRMSKEGEEELRGQGRLQKDMPRSRESGITKSSLLQWRQRSHPCRTTTSSLMEHQLSSQQLEEGNLVNTENAKYLMRLVTILPLEFDCIKRLQDWTQSAHLQN